MHPQSLTILYEDSHIIVCVKPSGTATQSKCIKTPDMESILKNHIAKAGSPNAISKEPYLAVIHRLDQPVRGIMVFAKTSFAAGELSRELLRGGFGKYYRALVCGRPPKPSDTLSHFIQKDARSNTSRICPKDAAGAKSASLTYRTIPEEQPYFSLPADIRRDTRETSFTELDIHLHTGRHHQIRVQLSHIGCPIVGDTKYNPAAKEASGFQELKLCSYRLDFTHPKTKKAMHFSLI